MTNSHDQFSYSGTSNPTVTRLNVSSGMQRTAVTITGPTLTSGRRWRSGVAPGHERRLRLVDPIDGEGALHLRYRQRNRDGQFCSRGSTNTADLFAYPSPAVGQVYPRIRSGGEHRSRIGTNLVPGCPGLLRHRLGDLRTWLSSAGIDVKTVPTVNRDRVGDRHRKWNRELERHTAKRVLLSDLCPQRGPWHSGRAHHLPAW